MRTVQFTVYNISELSPESRARAIGELRESLIETEDYEAVQWAIDDCALLEPAHDELVNLFGENYSEKIGDEFYYIVRERDYVQMRCDLLRLKD